MLSRNLVNEEAMAHWGHLRQKKAKYSSALDEGPARFSENSPDVIRAGFGSSFNKSFAS
jgi:hypothetical protein